MARAAEYAAQSNGRFVKLQDLRYGENPHQSAAFYRDLLPRARLARQRDAVAGQGAFVQQHRRRRRGVGMREVLRRRDTVLRDRQARQPVRRRDRRSATEAYDKALKTDPTSAFGGIIAFNRPSTARLRRSWPGSSSKC